VAADVNLEQVQAARDIITQLQGLFQTVQGPRPGDRSIQVDPQAARLLLQQLEQLGIPLFEGVLDRFETALGESNDPTRAAQILEDILGNTRSARDLDETSLLNVIRLLEESFGGASNDLEGVLSTFRQFQDLLGIEGNQAFQLLFDRILALGPEVLGPLFDQLQDLGEVDIETEAGQQFLDDFLENILTLLNAEDFEGLGAITNLTREQLDELLSTLSGFRTSIEQASEALDTSFRDTSRFSSLVTQLFDLEGVDALDDFLARITTLPEDVLGADLQRMLNILLGLDATTAEGQEQFQVFFRDILRLLGAGALGEITNLDEEEVIDLVTTLKNLLDGVVTGQDDDVSTSTSFTRVITEVTANELVAIGNTQEFHLRTMVGLMNEMVQLLQFGLVTGGGFGPFAQGGLGEFGSDGASFNFDVTINALPNTQSIMTEFEKEVKSALNGTFNNN
jgi:hypothetical protein